MKFAKSVLVALLASSSSSMVSAFSSGAGRCAVGEASPTDFHLTMPTTNTGLLEEGGYIITVGGTTVTNGGTATAIVGEAFPIDITASDSGEPFKGSLILVDGLDSSNIVPGEDQQLAAGGNCGGLAAVTHRDSQPKTTAFGVVTADEPITTTVELNIVVTNSGGVSTFYYSQVNLEVVEPPPPANLPEPPVEPEEPPSEPEPEPPIEEPPSEPEPENPIEPPPEPENPIEPPPEPENPIEPPPVADNGMGSIVDMVVANEALSALEGAVLAAPPALAEALSGPGPLTVFAPNDAAFAAADSDGLVTKFTTQPEWSAHLDYLLKFHVTEGAVLAAQVTDGMNVTTLAPLAEPVVASVSDDGVSFSSLAFTDSAVVQADLTATNGVVHVVDKVFIPNVLTSTVLEAATLIPGSEMLPQVVELTGLTETFNTELITVFGPDGEAFSALPQETLAAAASDPTFLKGILEGHVVAGVYPKSRLTDGLELMSLAGTPLKFSIQGDVYKVNGATIEIFDGVASNGVAHLIDMVLLAPTQLPEPATPDDMAPAPTPEMPIPDIPAPTPEFPEPPTPAYEPKGDLDDSSSSTIGGMVGGLSVAAAISALFLL